jgi:hypothetical protein
MKLFAAAVGVIVIATITPALAETLTCSTSFQGYRVCSGPGGYRSIEQPWQGRVIGEDNEGRRWTTSRWRDGDITTVDPGR